MLTMNIFITPLYFNSFYKHGKRKHKITQGGDDMVKKVFSIITFVFSILVLVALAMLTFDMVKEYIYINSLPSTSGSDYLGFLVYRMFCCVTALPGIVSSAVSSKISSNKAMKIISFVLLDVFIIIFVFFGIAWLNLM